MMIPPDIQSLMADLDMTVLYDCEPDGEDLAMLYAVGWEPELGIRGGTVTAWYESVDDVWAELREKRDELLRQYVPEEA